MRNEAYDQIAILGADITPRILGKRVSLVYRGCARVVLVKAKVNQVKSMLSAAGARRKQSCVACKNRKLIVQPTCTVVLRLRHVVLTNEEGQSVTSEAYHQQGSSEAQKVPTLRSSIGQTCAAMC